MKRRCGLKAKAGAVAGGVIFCLFPALASAGQPAAAAGFATLRVSTVPDLPGVRVALDGITHLTGANGAVTVSTFAGTHRISVLPPSAHRAGTAVKFTRWLDGIALSSRSIVMHQGLNNQQAGFQVSHPIAVRFSKEDGRPVPLSAVKRITMASSLGQQFTFSPDRPPRLLAANRIGRDRFGLYAQPIRYSVRDVLFGGANVVYGGSQSFYVGEHRIWTVRLLLFPMRIEVRDALFGFGIGSTVRVRLAGGFSRTVRLESGHAVTLHGMPRATYDLIAKGPGLGLSSPATLTKPLVARLLLLSWIDFAAVGAFAVLFVIGLPVVGGRIRRRKDGARLPGWHVGHPAEGSDLSQQEAAAADKLPGPQAPPPDREPVAAEEGVTSAGATSAGATSEETASAETPPGETADGDSAAEYPDSGSPAAGQAAEVAARGDDACPTLVPAGNGSAGDARLELFMTSDVASSLSWAAEPDAAATTSHAGRNGEAVGTEVCDDSAWSEPAQQDQAATSPMPALSGAPAATFTVEDVRVAARLAWERRAQRRGAP